MRQRGLKIGSCSGYPASVMRRVIERAATEGLEPECIVASDEVPRARPAPAMALKNVIELGLSDVAACVKVDDTAPGIEEGRRAGMWTVGLLLSGNAAGLTLEEYLSLDEAGRDAARARRRRAVRRRAALPDRHGGRPAGGDLRHRTPAGGGPASLSLPAPDPFTTTFSHDLRGGHQAGRVTFISLFPLIHGVHT